MIRDALVYRREAFCEGLKVAGFDVVNRIDVPKPNDLLVIWNRYGAYDEQAKRFEASHSRVIVVENSYLGKSWRGGEWFAMARNHHNGPGTWPYIPGRWDSWRVELKPWRTGSEIVILGQRGIGEPGIASPPQWAEQIKRKHGGRIRLHPGRNKDSISLEQDLANAKCVYTWGSAAAIKALTMGVPVHYDMPKWIGAKAASRIGEPEFTGDRLPTFRRLAGAMWELQEIKSGKAFEYLCA